MKKETKMKYLLSVLLLLILSCNQNHFDLDSLELPIHKDTILNKYNVEKIYTLDEFTEYKSENAELLWFKGQDFSGGMGLDKNRNTIFNNYVEFTVINKSNKIGAYTLHTETRAKTEQMIALMEQTFKKPEFHYRDEKWTSQIWKKDSLFYFFKTNNTIVYLDEPTKTSDLTVVSEKCATYINWITSGGSFAFYGNYLKEKKKKENDESFSYNDFVNQQLEEAKSWGEETTYYEKDYVR